MDADLNIDEIISHAERLNKEDQLSLLEKLSLMIRKSKKKNTKVKLSSISGVGSSIWRNIDIDACIDQERKW